MKLDLMTGANRWTEAAELSTLVEQAGFSGMLFTETSQVPWMQIAAAAMAAPRLEFSTGIAVAFPRSPMVAAAVGYELADNTEGRFRLGLGSQVRAHVERRYGSEFSSPAERMEDYVRAVKACLRAFNGDETLSHDGPFYQLSLLPRDWAPRRHDHPLKIDISAVGPLMTAVAGRVADGVHVHPLHSLHYLEHRLLPALQAGADQANRSLDDIDLIIPAFICPGDTPEERAPMIVHARQQIAFYGSTPNYSFQFDDLGFDGTTAKIRSYMKDGRFDEVGHLISDEMLDHFAIVSTWDDLPGRLVQRYGAVAHRVVTYMGERAIRHDPRQRSRWAEVASTVTQGE